MPFSSLSIETKKIILDHLAMITNVFIKRKLLVLHVGQFKRILKQILILIVLMAISCSVWLPSSFHGLLNHVFGQLKKIEKFLADARANVCSYLTTLSLVSHVIYNYGCH